MSAPRSPILEYATYNPVTAFTAPDDTTATTLTTELSVTLTNESGVTLTTD